MSQQLIRHQRHLIQDAINEKVTLILDRTAMSEAELRTVIGEARGLRQAQEIITEAGKHEP